VELVFFKFQKIQILNFEKNQWSDRLPHAFRALYRSRQAGARSIPPELSTSSRPGPSMAAGFYTASVAPLLCAGH
jgi:hypothetical protein